MLYLLSVADSMATGPKAWNDWTSSLLRSLFLKVLNILENGELATGRAVRTVEKKRQAVLSAMDTDITENRLETMLNFMPPRYMLYTPVGNIRNICSFPPRSGTGLLYGTSKNPRVRTPAR